MFSPCVRPAAEIVPGPHRSRDQSYPWALTHCGKSAAGLDCASDGETWRDYRDTSGRGEYEILLTYNFVTLEQDAEQTAQARDVLYTIILDRDGRVAAYSGHSEKQGLILPDPVSQQVVQARTTLIQRVPQTRQAAEHYDIAVPVFVPGSPEKWGTVRVGLSLHEMQTEIAQTRWRVLSLGILGVALSMVVAAFLARRIVAPLRVLTAGTVALARGSHAHYCRPDA